MSARQNSHRDKRVSKLARDSEKLRQEITELEDALILHSRFQEEDETSVQGMIRKEVGGSRWQHGGEGKLHTYRSNKDLTERSGHAEQRRIKEKSSNSHMQRQETGAQKAFPSHSTHIDVHKHLQHRSDERSPPKNKKERKAVDKTCLNGEWALKIEKTTEISKGKVNELDALKNKVLAKASTKVIKRTNFASHSVNKNNPSSHDKKCSNQIVSKNNDSHSAKNSKKREANDNNKQDNDISYSLSFLESLHETEIKESNLHQSSSIPDSKKSKEKQRDNFQLRNEFSRENDEDCDNTSKKNSVFSFDNDDVNADHSKLTVDTRDGQSHRWATDSDKISKDRKHDQPRTQRRNSVGGNCQQMEKEIPKAVSTNRQAQPVSESDGHLGNKNMAVETHPSNFPLLFGSVHKTQDFNSQNLHNHIHVSLGDMSSNSSRIQEVVDDESSLIGKTTKHLKSSKHSITICDEEVQSWLENLGLQDVDDYVALFADHEMDMGSIKLLTAGRLRDMGLHALGPIMKIMKGVQVLNRDSSLKENIHKEMVAEDETKETDLAILHDIEDRNKNITESIVDMENPLQDRKDERDLRDGIKVCSNESTQEMLQDKKPPKPSLSMLSWKKASEEAEYVNLSERSPVDDKKIPHAVSIKEKSKKIEKEKKNASTSKSGSRKMKSAHKTDGHSKEESQSTSKVVKKPPIKTKDGLSTAHEKLMEKKKQEELRIQSDQIMSARQRQLRDKMAARHTSRRSSSLERKSPRRDHQSSLNKTFSENQNQPPEVTHQPPITQSIAELLKTKPVGLSEIDGDIVAGRKTNPSASEQEKDLNRNTIEAKNLDRTDEEVTDLGSIDTNKSLNLNIVRQLKKQLNHIEQHLVQQLEEPIDTDTENVTRNNQADANERRKDVDKESNVRPSARERRRQRTPKQLATTLEGNSDIPQEFFKVGGILSHRKMKDNRSPSEDKDDLKARASPKEQSMHSPNTASILTKRGEDLLVETNRDLSHNSPRPRARSKESNEKLPRAPLNTETRQTELARGKLALAQEYLRKIEIDKKDISFEEKDLLGDGAFSQVYKGIYQGSEVAIKQLKTSLTSNDKNYFSAEVSLLQELRYPHVVMLLGVCTAYTCPVLVLEYLQGGNLYKRLHELSLPPFLKEEFCVISRDIASGICYLHNHRPPVLHLDLKSRNVLLGLGNRAKVADFGFSKWKVETDLRVSRSSKAKLSQGSPAWMAPELLSAGEITPKADVYSFGIVLWEMLAREDPYKGCSTFQILERVRTSQRPSVPHGCPEDLRRLMERCWENNPCIRPTFKEILTDLDKLSRCEGWIQDSLESTDKVERNQARKSYTSFAESDMMENVTKADTAFRHKNVTQMSNAEELIYAQVDDIIELDDFKQNPFQNVIQEECNDSGDEENGSGSKFGDSNKIKVDHKHEGKMDSQTLRDLSDPVTSLLQSTSPSETTNETETFEHLKSGSRIKLDLRIQDTEISSEEASGFSSPNNSPHCSEKHLTTEASGFSSPKKSPHGSEKQHSTTQMLLDSARDTKRLDELLHKYLPSPRPRNQTRRDARDSPMSNAEDATRKLLPLRQSLDKPRKPPKPLYTDMMALSKSENFGKVNNNNLTTSMKETEDSRLSARSNSGRDHIPQNTIDYTTEKSDNNQISEITSFDQNNQASSSSISNTSSRNQPFDTLLRDMDTSNDKKYNNQPRDSSNSIDKTSEASTSNNFSTMSKVTEPILSSLNKVSTQLTPPTESPLQDQLCQLNASTTIRENGNTPVYNVDTALNERDEQPSSLRSSNKIFLPIQTSDDDEPVDCDSSIATDMSVDSLSHSVSDDADSVDFSKGGSRHFTEKRGKSKGSRNPSVNASCKGVTYSSTVKKNQRVSSKPQGNVRDSFFLFSDFHLDLNKLSDNDSDIDEIPQMKPQLKSIYAHTKESRLQDISPKGKQLKSKNSLLLEHNQNPNKSPNLSAVLGSSGQSASHAHSLTNMKGNTGMSHALKESIQLATTSFKEKNASPTAIPPPPSLKISPYKKNNKDHSNPVMSGFPLKSSSSKPEVQGQSRFSVEPGLLLQQRNRLRSVLPEDLSPLKEASHGKSMPSVASILKKAMDERRLAIGDNLESQEGTTPDASWSIQD